MKHLATYLLFLTGVSTSFSVSSDKFSKFQERIKRMLAGKRFEGEVIIKRQNFQVGDCDSSNFMKGNAEDAKTIIRRGLKLDWAKVRLEKESNYFYVPLKDPIGKNPQYQGSRFYFKTSESGDIYWTGYCDLVEYK